MMKRDEAHWNSMDSHRGGSFDRCASLLMIWTLGETCSSALRSARSSSCWMLGTSWHVLARVGIGISLPRFLFPHHFSFDGLHVENTLRQQQWVKQRGGDLTFLDLLSNIAQCLRRSMALGRIGWYLHFPCFLSPVKLKVENERRIWLDRAVMATIPVCNWSTSMTGPSWWRNPTSMWVLLQVLILTECLWDSSDSSWQSNLCWNLQKAKRIQFDKGLSMAFYFCGGPSGPREPIKACWAMLGHVGCLTPCWTRTRCFAGPVRTAKLRVDQHAGAGLQLSACEAGSCYAPTPCDHVTSWSWFRETNDTDIHRSYKFIQIYTEFSEFVRIFIDLFVFVSSFSVVEAGYLVEELEDWPGQPDIRAGDVIVAIGEEIPVGGG